MAANKDYKPIFKALVEQGWTYDRTAGGHFKATPPSLAPIVTVSTTSRDPRDLLNTVRQLRKSGFVWPWPPSAEKNPPPKEPGLHLYDLFKHDATPKETPTMPPDPASTFTSAPVSTPAPATAPDVDTLFLRLKEARTYAALAKDARDEAAAAATAAQSALQGSEKELSLALAALRDCKEQFDREFGQ